MNNKKSVPTDSSQKPQKTAKKVSYFARISFWVCILGIIYFMLCIKFENSISEKIVIYGTLIIEGIALIFCIIAFFQVANSKKELSGAPYCGFVMIALLILAIAIPNILRFSARAKQSEAKNNLGAAYTVYQAYHNSYHTYPSAPNIQTGATVYNCFVGWVPQNDLYYTIYAKRQERSGWDTMNQIRYNYNCMNIEAFSPPINDSTCPPGIVTHADKDSFTVAACGNVDNDTTVDVWTINDAKKLKNVVDDVKL